MSKFTNGDRGDSQLLIRRDSALHVKAATQNGYTVVGIQNFHKETWGRESCRCRLA